MTADQIEPEGLRERKRRETLQRIADTALKLFLKHGYEATTLDAIAAAAGISRRTFFHYFKSKEDLLLAWQDGVPDEVRAAILAAPGSAAPVEVVFEVMRQQLTRFDSDQAITINNILRSNETLRAGKQAKYVEQEEVLFQALCERWPQAKRRRALRVLAMACVGAMRLAIDNWSDDGGKRPVTKYLRETFADLTSELSRS